MPHDNDALVAFIEDAGLYFDKNGLPATSGRILGHLLTCDPPVQSSSDLARALETTSGSISTNTRLLVAGGMIERVAVKGRRGVFFRAVEGAFGRMLEGKFAATRDFREILEKGRAALGDAPPERLERLDDALDLYRFFEAEFPKLIARYQEQRAARPKN